MIPFLESTGGSCQFAVILVEDAAATVKVVGACEGAVIYKKQTLTTYFSFRGHIMTLIILRNTSTSISYNTHAF